MKNTVLTSIIDTVAKLKHKKLNENEKKELKNAILDRIGCCLGAKRLGVSDFLSNFSQQNHVNGDSTIWGTNKKANPSWAALVNGTVSSHIEYDTHDSMIPAVIALAEATEDNGEHILRAMKTGHYVGVIVRRLLASNIEKRGLHWPAYLAAFTSSTACSQLLGLNGEETANAISIAASLSPVTPFEAFTKGATVKDLYGGWGNMLGVQSAQLASIGLTGPRSVFEGERGLFRNWLGSNPEPEVLAEALDIENIQLNFHIKPYPSCTAAHPTLTAVEKLLVENPNIRLEDIELVEVDTYRFGADLSNESNPDTPIGAKVNIPFLTASMLTHGQLLPEHSEEPWINDPSIRKLAERVVITSNQPEDELITRRRGAHVAITLKNGRRVDASAEQPRWSNPRATQSEVHNKFKVNVGDYLPENRIDEIIQKVSSFERLDDIKPLMEDLTPV